MTWNHFSSGGVGSNPATVAFIIRLIIQERINKTKERKEKKKEKKKKRKKREKRKKRKRKKEKQKKEREKERKENYFIDFLYTFK